MNIENQENMNAQEGDETQSDFDTTAAIADISSELFGQGDDGDGNEKSAEGEEQLSAGAEAGDVVASPQQAEETSKVVENTAEVQETGAPKTWTKEALETWATVPPRAQQEILKREEDFMKGIQGYKALADVGNAYNQVVAPYAPVLAAENIDPVQMFQSFAANHYLLTRGTPEQKIELAASMLSGYNIPLPDLLNYMADNIGEPADPKIAQLEKELAEIKSGITSQQSAVSEARGKEIAAEIEAFAADPAHPYFDEVADHIQRLFASGAVSTLQDAYDTAVFANPALRQKEIDRLTAERTSTLSAEEQKRRDKVAKSTADTVTLTPKSRDGTVLVGSIDDTLSETMAQIAGRA